jgi:cellulose synthase/poly-beta-1,6-N-acetylglucosamine synthase-like glycosyltransferase
MKWAHGIVIGTGRTLRISIFSAGAPVFFSVDAVLPLSSAPTATAMTIDASSTPKVSILIPCFNAKRWIGQAIESALAQTYMSTKIIVVDDGSTDGSLEVLRRFGRLIRWETGPNRGANV